MLRDDMMRSWRLAGQVKRYHTWPTLQQQTVADHTWHVMRIYYQLFGPPDVDVWTNILLHDITEMWSGDIPYPQKQKVKELSDGVVQCEYLASQAMGIKWPALSEREHKKIKLCDLIEMYEFGVQEVAMGNSFGSPIRDSCRNQALSIASELGVGEEVLKHMERNGGLP